MNTPFHLTGKTVLITGASSGIGRQVAISVSEMGGTCVISGRNEDALNETLSQLRGDGHSVVKTDVTVAAERDQLIQHVPGLDGVAYCAGNVTHFPIKFMNQKHIDEMMHLNFEAPVLLIGGLLKAKKIKEDASLVFMSSISGQFPPKGGSMYGASKAALESFVKTLAQEVVHQRIRANCLSPGMVRTPLYDRAEEAVTKEEMDKHVRNYPLGIGEPTDVANAVVYLLSPASRWVTGINLTLDGGFLTCS